MEALYSISTTTMVYRFCLFRACFCECVHVRQVYLFFAYVCHYLSHLCEYKEDNEFKNLIQKRLETIVLAL